MESTEKKVIKLSQKELTTILANYFKESNQSYDTISVDVCVSGDYYEGGYYADGAEIVLSRKVEG